MIINICVWHLGKYAIYAKQSALQTGSFESHSNYDTGTYRESYPSFIDEEPSDLSMVQQPMSDQGKNWNPRPF